MVTNERTVHTTCPYCGVGCQMDLHMQNGFIYRVTGRYDNDVNYGNLCVKGRFGYDFLYAPDRLETPLMRGSRESAFLPASWEEAYSHVSERLLGIREEYGPDSIAFLASAKCTNEENYLIQKLARGVVGTNNVDHCARL
jgi:predicted molibdopterin-dependent oxidoreductase YjgC